MHYSLHCVISDPMSIDAMLNVHVQLPCVIEEKVMLYARDKYQVASAKVVHKKAMKQIRAAAIQMDRSREGDECRVSDGSKYYLDPWSKSMLDPDDLDKCETRTWAELEFGQIWVGGHRLYVDRPQSRKELLIHRGPEYVRENCKQYDVLWGMAGYRSCHTLYESGLM